MLRRFVSRSDRCGVMRVQVTRNMSEEDRFRLGAQQAALLQMQVCCIYNWYWDCKHSSQLAATILQVLRMGNDCCQWTWMSFSIYFSCRKWVHWWCMVRASYIIEMFLQSVIIHCPGKNCNPLYLAITLANNVGFFDEILRQHWGVKLQTSHQTSAKSISNCTTSAGWRHESGCSTRAPAASTKSGSRLG